jgi:hypothetical protein
VRNEVALPDDEPRLVRLMLDYLYQLDYNCESGSRDVDKQNEEIHGRTSTPDAEPVSPVTETIRMFESRSAPAFTNTDEGEAELVFSVGKKKDKKDKKRRNYLAEPLPKADAEPQTAPESIVCAPEGTDLRTHAQMYALADKYGISDLKELARDKFADAVDRNCYESEFSLAIRTVYASTPDDDMGLRDVVVETIREHRELLSKADVEEVVKENTELAFALLKSVW